MEGKINRGAVDFIHAEYKSLKLAIKEDAHYINLSGNRTCTGSLYDAYFAPSISEASAEGFTASTNSRIDSKVFSSLYDVSMSYEYSDVAQAELCYIQLKSGIQINHPTPTELDEYSENYGVVFKPYQDVVGLAMEYYQTSLKHGDIDTAKYFIKLIYDFTLDKEIKNMYEDIMKKYIS